MTRSRLLGIGLVVMIVLPAVVFAVLGYGSFEAEARVEASERRLRVRLAFNRAHAAATELFDRVEQIETARDFWNYESLRTRPDDGRGSTPLARPRSPLAGVPPWPFVRGYFQLDPARSRLTSPRRPAQQPQVSGPSEPNALDKFLADVGEILRQHPVDRLAEAAGGRTRTHHTAGFAWTGSARSSGGSTSFRYGSFIYMPAPAGVAVCAVRRVSWTGIDGTDRVLYQGFVIDIEDLVRRTLPTLLVRASGDPAVRVRVIDTPVSFYAYPPNRALGAMLPGLSLVAEESDPDLGAASVAAARERFVLLVGALFAVIGVGLFLLRRTVTAELALARRRADFVSAVSHELRTPLTGIRMYADMLRDGWVKDEETVRHYHESMARESERLSRLVQNVLDFSALEKGRKDFKMERGDLAEPVRAAVDLLAPYLEEKRFEVSVEVEPGLPEVKRDPDAVQQCVVNLVDNAVKYARDHEPRRIVVGLAKADGRVELTVRDHGPGLTSAERERAFEAFYRGGSTTAKEVGGAGLGLALVKRFADAHRGRAEVEDAPGGGALFRVHFPTA